MPGRAKRIGAAEVGQYAYCARAWWLATIEKREPAGLEPLEHGTQVHERHGWQVSLARGVRWLALLLLLAAAAALAIWAAGAWG